MTVRARILVVAAAVAVVAAVGRGRSSLALAYWLPRPSWSATSGQQPRNTVFERAGWKRAPAQAARPGGRGTSCAAPPAEPPVSPQRTREEWLAIRDRAEDSMRRAVSDDGFLRACIAFERAAWELGEHWDQAEPPVLTEPGEPGTMPKVATAGETPAGPAPGSVSTSSREASTDAVTVSPSRRSSPEARSDHSGSVRAVHHPGRVRARSERMVARIGVGETGRVHPVARRVGDREHRERLLRRLPVPRVDVAQRGRPVAAAPGVAQGADVQGVACVAARRRLVAGMGDGGPVRCVTA